MNTYNLPTFVRAYLECALWSSAESEEPLNNGRDVSDFAPAAIVKATEDCADFQAACAADLEGIDDSQAGHDFWLTRNRHGVGFWDRGLGAVGDRLTMAAHAYGESDAYLGDDGKMHLS